MSETDNIALGNHVVPTEWAQQLERQRDEAITTIEDAKRALKATDYEGILLAAMRVKEERDEAREALMKIEDLFIDGTDIYADREKMGMIAREALEGATNHACGTPLSIALRERNEARRSLECITEYGTEEINAAVELRQKLAQALIERDEAREELHDIRLNLGDDAEGYTLLHAVCVIQNELNEARAVADELSSIAARYLGWHLSRTPMGPDDDHLAQARRITETLARWKALASA